MSDVIYCGQGKTIDGKYGQFNSLTLDISILEKYAFTGKDGKKKVVINASERKAPDQYGNNLKATVSQFKPSPPPVTNAQQNPDREDLPF
jgi:hypothetical protein